MRSLDDLRLAIPLSILLGLAVGYVMQNPTFGFAAFGAAMTVYTVWHQRLVDRPDWRVKVRRDFFGPSTHQPIVMFRVTNYGRRPVRVERAYFSSTKGGEVVSRPWWMAFAKGTNEGLPFELTESQAAERWTWPKTVSERSLSSVPPHWLVVEDSYEHRVWVELPADVVSLLDEAWAKRQEPEGPEEEAPVAT